MNDDDDVSLPRESKFRLSVPPPLTTPPPRQVVSTPSRAAAQPHTPSNSTTSPSVENFTTIDWLDVDDENKPALPRASKQSPRRGQGRSPNPLLRGNARASSLDHLDEAALAREELDDDSDMFMMLGGTLSYCFDASQPWVAAMCVGIACGVIASAVEMVTHWLTDLRLGFCRWNVWVSEYQCCVHDSQASLTGGRCDAFVYWADWLESRRSPLWSEMSVYVALSTCLAVLSCFLCVEYSPYAAGSGITEMKTILSGIRIHAYMSVKVLCIKCIGLCSAVGSGLALGKEGPFVHVGCCVGNLIGKWFPMYRHSETSRRELISSAAAAGVAVAFGAPIGGVLFSLEEVSYFFPHRTMIQAFFTAIVSTLVMKKIDATNTGRVVLFSVSYRHEFHWFELTAFALIGVLGGVVGAAINRLNANWCHIKRHSLIQLHPIREIFCVAFITAALNFVFPVLRGGMLGTLADLFDDCSSMDRESFLCVEDETRVLIELTIAALIRMVQMALTFGCKLPAGCFVPALFIGGCFGRAVGIWTKSLVVHHLPTSEILQLSCGSDAAKCIFPGVYAIVGAAAVLAGVTRMTLCLVVIMFELTGGLEYVVPCMLATITSKWIAELLGVPSIYEIHLALTQYPYLNTKDEFPYRTTLREMLSARDHSNQRRRERSGSSTQHNAPCIAYGADSNRLVVLFNGILLHEVEAVVSQSTFHWYPIVEGRHNSSFVGCVSRVRLQQQLELVRAHRGGTSCHFEGGDDGLVFFSHAAAVSGAGLPPPTTTASSVADEPPHLTLEHLDWSHLIDTCSIQATLDMTVHKVLHVFKALGNQHMVIVDGGRLVGLLTRKDLVLFLRSVRAEGGARGSLMRWISTRGSGRRSNEEVSNDITRSKIGGHSDETIEMAPPIPPPLLSRVRPPLRARV